MKFVVVGYKKIVRKSDKVNFIEFNCERDDKLDEGVGVEKFFIRADKVENIDSLKIGSELKCYYNQFGRIDIIELN